MRLLLLFLFITSIKVHAQKCEEIDDFDNIEKLTYYGKCYLEDTFNHSLISVYDISKEMKSNDPGLIYLILNSSSISDEYEKQSWFYLYSQMTKEQTNKLYIILIKEKKKLNEITIRYDEKKYEIQKKYLSYLDNVLIPELSDDYNVFSHLQKNKNALKLMEYQFLGSPRSDTALTPEVWKYDFETNMLISIIYKNNQVKAEDFEFYVSKNPDDEFDFLTIKYIKNVYLIDSEYSDYNLLFPRTLPTFSLDYLMFGLSYFYKNRMLKELSQLLNISPDNLKHTIDSSKFKEFQELYYRYSSSYNSIIKNYTVACEGERFNLLNGNNDFVFDNLNSIILEMLVVTNYDANNCNQCSKALNEYISSKLKFITIDSIDLGRNIQTEFMHFDFIKIFNSNDEIKTFCQNISNFVIESKKFENEFIFKDKWSYILTNKYINNELPMFKSLDELNTYADNLISQTKINNKQTRESTLFEFYAYYTLYHFANNKITIQNISYFQTIIDEANKIGNNPSLEAYYYVEKYIIDLISKRLNFQSSNKTNIVSNIYSISIGVSDYLNLSKNDIGEMKDLDFAAKDAEDFSQFIKNTFDDKIIQVTLTDGSATQSNVKRTIQEILYRATEDDIVYLFFSGHGRTTYANESYFLTYDFIPDDEFSGVEHEWLIKQIRDSKAKQIFVFIDACKSGLLGNGVKTGDLNNNLYFNEIDKFQPHKIIFTSSSDSQNSYEDSNLKNGVFTYYLLKGLNGACENSRNDGFIRFDDLRNYLIENVFKSKKQLPNVTGEITNEDIPISIRKI